MVDDHLSDPERALTALGMPRQNENLLKYSYFIERDREIKHYFSDNQNLNKSNATIDCGVYLFSKNVGKFKIPYLLDQKLEKTKNRQNTETISKYYK